MRKKFFSLLVLLAAVVTSAMAQEESLLTTLTFGDSETYGETTSGVVTVIATNVDSYNGTYGWLLAEGSSLSVTAKEGYTITKCVFRQNAKTPITDTEAPFEIHTNDWGGIIEDPWEEMNGVTSIEVYGYANAGGGSTTTVVTITQDDFPKWVDSFTKDGVTVSAGIIDYIDGNLEEGGSFSTTLGNFTQIEVSAKNVNISGEGWSGDSQKMTWTGNASSVEFTGDIWGYGQGTTLIFTIEPASTPEPEPQGETTTVTWNSSTLSSILLYDGSFTKDGVTVTVLSGTIDGQYGEWMGYTDDSFKFSTSLGKFTRIEITGTIYSLHGSGWTQTSPGAVWTGEANETTFGDYFNDVTQIVFTIEEPAPQPTAIENVQTNHVQGTKILRDGQLLIIRDGKIYNATGAEVK